MQTTWIGIVVTVVGGSCSNIGKVLQKKGADQLPRITVSWPILKQYLTNPTWITGAICDSTGGAMIGASFAFAPVSILQPVSSIGLAALALFQYLYYKVPLSILEWMAVLFAMVGTAGLGLSGVNDEDLKVDKVDYKMLARLFGALIVYYMVVGFRRVQHSGGSRYIKLRSEVEAVVAGLEAGIALAFSAACVRTGWQLMPITVLSPVVGLGVGVGLSATAFYIQNSAFKDGSAVLVATSEAISSMAGGVLVGLFLLAESMPQGKWYTIIRCVSWALLIVAVTVLAQVKGPSESLSNQTDETTTNHTQVAEPLLVDENKTAEP